MLRGEHVASLGDSRSSSWSSLPPDDCTLLDERRAYSIAEKCITGLIPGGTIVAHVDFDVISCKCIQGLWSGMGGLHQVVGKDSNQEEFTFIVKLIRRPESLEFAEKARDYDSYHVELSFYQTGFAEQLINAEALCPKFLYAEDDAKLLTLCMTNLVGHKRRKLSENEVKSALTWLAKLHAKFWGHARSDAAVSLGLQSQGCYWHLDCRRAELASMGQEDFGDRLRLAAVAFDSYLKTDALQTICHGDSKEANMIFDDDGTVAFCDFQWVGKASASKDIAYCLLVAAGRLTEDDEATYLQFYHDALCSRLASQGDDAPTMDSLRSSYDIAVCDLARWMCGSSIGWWGHKGVLRKRTYDVLTMLDSGSILGSSDEYTRRVLCMFPR